MVGVAQGGLVGGKAQEAAREGRGGERLALAQGAEEGGLGAHDLVEAEERRAGREGRRAGRTGLLAGPARPARQGLPEPGWPGRPERLEPGAEVRAPRSGAPRSGAAVARCGAGGRRASGRGCESSPSA